MPRWVEPLEAYSSLFCVCVCMYVCVSLSVAHRSPKSKR